VYSVRDSVADKMASSKLRRTPLFGYDGNLGIPIQANSQQPTASKQPLQQAPTSNGKVRKAERGCN